MVTEATPSSQFEFRDYLRILWGHKWIVVLATLAVVGAGLRLSLREPRVYRAHAQLLLADNSGAAGQVDTETRLIESAAVSGLARQTLPGASGVSAQQAGTSRVIDVTAEGRTRTRAAASPTADVN